MKLVKLKKNRIKKDFFSKNAEIVAKELLGKILVRRIGNKLFKAKIVETEAYFDEKDPASRARQNGDLRKTMLLPGGVILIYGVHNSWLMNIVTSRNRIAEAVLLRALEPLNFNKNTKGPGLLTKSLNIDKSFHKKDIYNSEILWIEQERNNKFEIISDKRIGIKKDLQKNLRFYIKGNKFVSKK